MKQQQRQQVILNLNKIQDPDLEVDYKESPMNSLSKMEKYKFYVNANHSVLKKDEKDDKDDELMQQCQDS